MNAHVQKEIPHRAEKERVVDALLKLSRGGAPRYSDIGLCDNFSGLGFYDYLVSSIGFTLGSFSCEVCSRWEEFSGDRIYPVDGAMGYHSTWHKWGGEKGRKRRRYAGFLAEELRKEWGMPPLEENDEHQI